MSTLNIILLSLAEIIGDFGYKAYARAPTPASFAQGSFGYVGVIYF